MSFLNFLEKPSSFSALPTKNQWLGQLRKFSKKEGATVIYSVRSEARKESTEKLLKDRKVYVCDVEFEDQIIKLAEDLKNDGVQLDGFLHSIAFANYSEGFKPFHETKRADFLQATSISSFSLVELARYLKPILSPEATIVSVGISSQVTAENYGYMAPIKAALKVALILGQIIQCRYSSTLQHGECRST